MKAPTVKEMENKTRQELIQMMLDKTYAQRARNETFRRVGIPGAARYLRESDNVVQMTSAPMKGLKEQLNTHKPFYKK